jgi:eukaryotic-like serine/threonine-protein kinase
MIDVEPKPDDSSERQALRRVVEACERFQADWRTDHSRRIDAYVNGVEPSHLDRLVRGLMASEVELCLENGESPSREQYRARYPEWPEAVEAIFAGAERSSVHTRALDGRRTDADCSRRSTEIAPSYSMTAGGPDITTDLQSGAPQPGAVGQPLPVRFGRYVVTGLLGTGGFGTVYLAWDEELGRKVAIKVPRPGLLGSAQQVESFIAEGRITAALGHPAIVAVHDIGRHGENSVFVVFEYIEGRSLAEIFDAEPISPARLVRLMVTVAEAAHAAHAAGLIHRDLKPSNVLIDQKDRPHVADFGLALREDLQRDRIGEIAGTPPYMAPEQVRGETHRLDGRTDVWAIGVMLYQGLVCRQPFAGRSRNEVFAEILDRDPKPPRQVSASVPRELERICLKCLSKRMADRYETAGELADDLKTWLVAEASTDTFSPAAIRSTAARPAVRVVPKGLRAFDFEDADFFPTLVPGPRDRDGVPESIRAWRRRIEEKDPGRTFAVGLLYGPSGSGKSSLVKAGVIPRLAAHVRPVYVESSAAGTEASLLAALHRECPGLPADCRLDQAAAAVREQTKAQRGLKILLVIDQFEQWLQSHPDLADGDLIRALRHCDGQGLQVLLLVRDDFWMAITRFARALEVPLVEGVNSAPAELFNLDHAEHVLAELGRALGRIPEEADLGPGTEVGRFLQRAVQELAGCDGRVIPVRLTLLALMLRHRAWTTATLSELGGMEGIGVTFLEETFSAQTAPPAHRFHQRAAQAVLKALLPDAGSVLKGGRRSAQMLQDASGYAERPVEFGELIHILDNELRMVTPADAAGAELGTESGGRSPAASETHYQLTHDYLVPPLRQWLTRKQSETRRGRAELQLASITLLWRDRPEARRLPSLFEWTRIITFTNPRAWTGDERRMMHAASKHYIVRAVSVLALACTIAYGAKLVRNRDGARAALEGALAADFSNIPDLLPELAVHRALIRPALEELEASPSTRPHDREVAGILLYRDQPTSKRAEFLREHLLVARPDEVDVIRNALVVQPNFAGTAKLREVLLDETAERGARLRALCVLTKVEPAANEISSTVAVALADALLGEHRRELPRWLTLLGPSARLLVPPLGAICRDKGADPTNQSSAAGAVADILKHERQPVALAHLAVESTEGPSRILLRELVSLGPSDQVLSALHQVLEEHVLDAGDDAGDDALAARQAAAAIALAALGEPGALWPLLRHRADPRVRSFLIERLAADTLSPKTLVDRVLLPDVDPIERQAVLLAWAEMRHPTVAAPVKSAIVDRARELYLTDPHPAVHSAAELLLWRWGGPALLGQCDLALRSQTPPTGARRWELGPNGHTFVVLAAPLEFRMGASPHETAHYHDPIMHYRKVERSIAVATKEVTVAQFQAFKPGHRNEPRYGDEPDRAAIHLSWFAAAAYCNWLSAQAGIERDQWSYPEPVQPGMVITPESVKRTGFRLPTEVEWEYFCRAGTETSRPYGESIELLPRYAWTWLNSGNRVMPPGLLLPNEFGLFDVLGNTWEWCQDGTLGHYVQGTSGLPPYPHATGENPAPEVVRTETVDSQDRAHETWRILRGGAYSYAPDRARSAFRDWQPAGDEREYLGLRVVRTMPH